MLASPSARPWVVAMGLSLLAHVGIVCALPTRWPAPREIPVVRIELEERPTPPEVEKPRPPEAVPKPPPPPPPTPPRARQRVEPPKKEEIMPPPAPPIPPPTVETPPPPPPPIARAEPAPPPPPAAVQAPTPAPAAPPRSDPNDSAIAIGPASRTSTQGEPSARPAAPSGPASGAVANVPSSKPGSGADVARSTGTSNDGITRWASPRGGYQVYPTYPASARRSGIEGTARLRVEVLADGRVGEIQVEASAGHPDLDRAATDAVKKWRFEPARKGAEAVASWVILPVEFRIERSQR